ncbi:MAG: type II toxin-antitoxin system HipA family toxin, partial [Mucinivorans sp.]
MNRCLYCYQELAAQQVDFHPRCAKKIFGSATAPVLPYTRADITELAEQVIRSQTTLTGVQAKLSLDISTSRSEPKRFTV